MQAFEGSKAVGFSHSEFCLEVHAFYSTLDSLYGQLDAAQANETSAEEEFSLFGAIGEALATIPANLSEVAGTMADPLGLSVGDIADQQVAAEEQEVSTATFNSMVTLFGSGAAAFAYMLFILLYFPCSAAIAAVYRETNLKWTIFIGTWTTMLAYVASTTFYQVATFRQHPAFSLAWLAVEGVFFIGVFALLTQLGKRKDTERVILVGARA